MIKKPNETTENKRKLILEGILLVVTLLSSISLIMVSGLATLDTPVRITLMVIGFVVMAGGITVAAVLEMTSGYFECAKCGEYFTPTKTAYIMGAHTIMRRHLRCPKCGKRSWCYRRLSLPEDKQ